MHFKESVLVIGFSNSNCFAGKFIIVNVGNLFIILDKGKIEAERFHKFCTHQKYVACRPNRHDYKVIVALAHPFYKKRKIKSENSQNNSSSSFCKRKLKWKGVNCYGARLIYLDTHFFNKQIQFSGQVWVC